MSQAKVDKYKQEKYNRKKNNKKSNFKKIAAYVVCAIIAAAFVVYIGAELTNGFVLNDNVAHFAHVIGGVCGGSFGYILLKDKKSQE